jgi:tetratricopeptide (TPR) repeat protein
MPSLNALGEFKSSFNNIANEKSDVEARNQPFNDLALPSQEAAPMEMPLRAPPPNFGESSAETGGDFDFNSFLNSLPSDINPPPLDEPPSVDELLQGTAPPSSADPPSLDDLFASMGTESGDGPEISGSDDLGLENIDSDTPASEDFSVPEGLLPSEPDMASEDFPPDLQSGDFGLGDFGSDYQDTGSDDMGTDDFGSDFGAIDLGGESPDDNFNIENQDGESGQDDLEPSEGIDLGGESPETFSEDESDKSSADNILPDIDFSGLGETPQDEPDFDLGSNIDGSIETGTEGGDFGAIDLGGESLGDNFNTEIEDGEGGTGPDEDIDFGGEFPETFSEDESDKPSADNVLPDIDFSGLGEAPQDEPDFDMGDETLTSFDEGALDTGGDILGDLGSDFSSESIDLNTDGSDESPGLESSGGDLGVSDDFDLPGLDEIFEKNKARTTEQPAPKKGLFGKKKKAAATEEESVSEDIGEIQLTQEELDSILNTLSFYPLNLRIICEELIAEQVILPQQLSKLIRLLINGAGVRETAKLAEEITGKPVVIQKAFEKMTGAAFEAEQASFAYIFIHNFLPVLRLFAVIAAFAASAAYLGYKFVYIPVKAESIYKRGYERIPAGEYQRANQLFDEAFVLHQKKKWFYQYAEAFRDERRYLLAEEKYDNLLRYYPRDKKGVLDYANLQTYHLLNYDKANRLLQQELLDYAPNDFDGLLAAGDNFLAWADSDPSRFYDKYEDARFSYARLLEKYGWQPPVVERMLRYFIRTDNLKEVLQLRVWFENDRKRTLSASSLADLGGYLLDKQLEEVKGVPDPYLGSIESVRGMLLQAIRADRNLPEAHYHLARYHNNLGNTYEERLTLENAIRAFDLADTETVRRRLYRVDSHYRYANLLINNREFFPAEENVVKGIQLYEDYLTRNLVRASPALGKLYAVKGDLEYFVKSGDMRAALNDYRLAERYGYAPPEMQYRMGSAYYQLEDWRNSLEYLFKASAEMPLNRRVLYALGNVTYKRGDYFAAQGYYNRLLDMLENQRIRLPVLLPNDSPEFFELGERLMMARNNAGVVYEALAEQTGSREYRSRALAMYAESARAWDSITRNPETMVRMRLSESPGAPGINLGYLNASNAMRPSYNYIPEIFVRIDKDAVEPSHWEELAPFGGLQ